MTLDEQIEILHAAKRGEKIEWAFSNRPEPRCWYQMDMPHKRTFNFSAYDYRIADPYAELKAAAKDPTKQIRCNLFGEGPWYDTNNPYLWKWSWEPKYYEIRDKPKPKKVVKYLCYESQSNQLN